MKRIRLIKTYNGETSINGVDLQRFETLKKNQPVRLVNGEVCYFKYFAIREDMNNMMIIAMGNLVHNDYDAVCIWENGRYGGIENTMGRNSDIAEIIYNPCCMCKHYDVTNHTLFVTNTNLCRKKNKMVEDTYSWCLDYEPRYKEVIEEKRPQFIQLTLF